MVDLTREDKLLIYKVYRNAINHKKGVRMAKDFFPGIPESEVMNAVHERDEAIKERIKQNTLCNQKHQQDKEAYLAGFRKVRGIKYEV